MPSEIRVMNLLRNFVLVSPRILTGFIRCGHRRFSVDSLPNKGGLFGLGTVRNPKDFRALTDHVYEKGRSLCAEALAGRQRKRKLVSVLDELSDTICQAADMAECIRMVHPVLSFADEAEHCVSQLGQFVESLNSNRDIYMVLRQSLETNDADSACREQMDDIDRRVTKLLIDDMELSGVHLPDAQRCQFIEYHSAIFATGSEFVRNAHECKAVRRVRNTNEDFLRRQGDRLKTLLTLRHRLALLVGYTSFAERAVKGSFLETPTHVNQFLITLIDELKTSQNGTDALPPSIGSSSRELEHGQLPVLSKNEDPDTVVVSLNQLVCDKINPLAERLTGLRFERKMPDKEEVWDATVTKLVAYDAERPGKPLGVVYCDWYDRDRKCGEAHFTVRCGRELRSTGVQQAGGDAYQTPIVVLSFRLTPPKSSGHDQPDADHWNSTIPLTGTEVETILHEFGHAFHTLVGRTRYQHVSGTRCSTDLAEIPSTFMEHYISDENAAQPLFGQSFDRHRAISRKNASAESLHQSLLAIIDLRLHSIDPEHAQLEDICASVGRELNLETLSFDRLLVFEHLVPYGAKYHSYIVARALAALLWRRGGFITSPFDCASKNIYRRLLGYGGEKYPLELMQLTLNEVPSVEALAKSLAADVIGDPESMTVSSKKNMQL